MDGLALDLPGALVLPPAGELDGLLDVREVDPVSAHELVDVDLLKILIEVLTISCSQWRMWDIWCSRKRVHRLTGGPLVTEPASRPRASREL